MNLEKKIGSKVLIEHNGIVYFKIYINICVNFGHVLPLSDTRALFIPFQAAKDDEHIRPSTETDH